MNGKSSMAQSNPKADAEFRDFIADLFAMAAGMQSLRRAIARRIGLGGTELGILLSVGRLAPQGAVNVRQVADHLHVAATHITTEVNTLVAKGLLEKQASELDSRAVELSVTQAGTDLLQSISPHLQMINEALFDRPAADVISQQRRFFRGVLTGLPEALARLPPARK
jgi:DNA-binding MarR family transcriptional regulator